MYGVHDGLQRQRIAGFSNTLQKVIILSDVDDGAFRGAKLIVGSHKKMEGMSLGGGFLLDFTSRDYSYSNDELSMGSDSMNI